MRKQSKKFLSLCLALVMALSLVPTAALAADITITEIAAAKYEQIGEVSEGLIAVKLGGKWGFVDLAGKEVIPCKYDAAAKFSEGLAAVELNDKWGYIDQAGNEVISFQYSRINNFSNGVAIVQQDGYSVIDKTGKELTERKYDYIRNFSEGFAAVRAVAPGPFYDYYSGKWGFIDMTGREVISCQYRDVTDFSDGFASVELTNECNIIDTVGQYVFPENLKYDSVKKFSEGFAVVYTYVQEGTVGGKPYRVPKYGVIDTAGKEVVPCIYDSIDAFEGGTARVKMGNQWGLIDTAGKAVIPFLTGFNSLIFSEGLAAVNDEITHLFGYIDRSGNMVIPFQYSYAGAFVDGFAMVAAHSGKYTSSGDTINYYGIIDKTGKEIVSPNEYSIIGDSLFSEGLATVLKNGKYGFVDTTGKEVISCKYDWVSSFSNGFSVVRIGQCGLIDKTGKEVLPCKYEGISILADGILRVKLDGKYGLLALTVTGKAKESKQTISIDGKNVSFAMYSPDNGGTNYVRLVDLAMAMKGTAGQFNVGYDGKVLLTTGEAYEGTASTAPFHSEMEYKMLNEPTYVNGGAQNLEAIRFEYQNGGYTYYKLRDLGQALGFNVGWDNATQRIYIESDKPYDPNN